MKPLYIDWATLLELVPLGKSTLEQEVRTGRFPKPRVLSGRRVGWLLREVEEWAESRAVSELPPPPNTGAKKPRSDRDRTGAHSKSEAGG